MYKKCISKTSTSHVLLETATQSVKIPSRYNITLMKLYAAWKLTSNKRRYLHTVGMFETNIARSPQEEYDFP